MAEDFTIVTEIFVDGAWQNISADVRDRDEVVIERGIPDETKSMRTGSMSFTLNNGRSNVAGNVIGRYTPRNAASDLFGKIGRNTPVRQSIEGFQRFTGEISEWPQSWGLAGEQDCWIRVRAYGILRRLGQGGGKPAQSALKRRLLQLPFGPVAAFWPLDEGELVNIGEPLIGSSPFVFVTSNSPAGGDHQFGQSELAPWIGSGLKFLPAVTTGSVILNTVFQGEVVMPATVTEFSAEFLMRYEEGASRDSGHAQLCELILRGPSGASQQEWKLTADTFGPTGQGILTITLNVGGVQEFTTSITGLLSGIELADGDVHHVMLHARDSGATSITAKGWVDGKQVLSTTDSSAPATLQGVVTAQFRYAGETVGGNIKPLTIGHLALRHTIGSPAFDEDIDSNTTFFAAAGYVGERAGRRIKRLCEEEGIPFGYEGTTSPHADLFEPPALDLTRRLGHQQIAPVLDLLDQAATVDGGILYESRDSPTVNLLVGSDGTFEDGTIGSWVTPLAANTVANSGGAAHEGIQEDSFFGLRVTRITSSGPIEVWSNDVGAVARIPVTPGQRISSSMWVNPFRAGGPATPDGRIRLEFFDSGNTSLGVTEGPFLSMPAFLWQWLSLTAVVPAGAVTARVGFASGTISVNDGPDIDDVFVVRGIEPVLTKQTGAGGLVYATMEGLYNRFPQLALDYGDSHISPPFDPVEDDQLLVNDATAKRYNGGNRRITKTSGPLSVLAPPAGVGRYDREYTANEETDDALLQHASYRMEFGTFDEARFPEVGFRVRKWPELLLDYLRIDSGSWVSIAHPPPWLPPETIGCLIRGYRERYSRADWSCVWWTVPSGLYSVGVVETDRLDSELMTVGADFVAGTDTALTVALDSPVLCKGTSQVVTTPNHASFAITDLEFKIDLALDTWQPSATTEIAGRQLLTGNQRSWLLHMGSDGSIRLRWSTDGTAELDSISTFKPLLAPGSRLALRVTLDVNDGAGNRVTTFYSAPTIAGPWKQEHQLVVAGTTTIFASTAPLDIGDVQTSGFAPMSGKVYAAELLASIGGAAVANPDFTKVAYGTDVLSFTDAAGKVWTLTGGAVLDRKAWAATGASDYRIRSAGSLLHVTNVADALGVQTFTVDQVPVNGIRKTIPARTALRLDPPWRLAL